MYALAILMLFFAIVISIVVVAAATVDLGHFIFQMAESDKPKNPLRKALHILSMNASFTAIAEILL